MPATDVPGARGVTGTTRKVFAGGSLCLGCRTCGGRARFVTIVRASSCTRVQSMKLPVTCVCGATLRIGTQLEGQPIPCPKCAAPNTLLVPRAAPVSAPSAALPEWFIVPLLAYLTMVSLVIALVGYWAVQPTVVAVEREPMAATGTAPPMMAPNSNVEPDVHREEPVTESFLLPRRMPLAGVEQKPVPVFAEAMIKPAVDDAPDRKPAVTWAVDKPAEQKAADLHFSLRRLSLDGDVPGPLRLAVTPVGHDDVGSVLTRMGDGYRYTILPNQELLSLPKLRNYDVIFLTCVDLYAQDFQAAVPLRKFVEQGGTLYASDLRGDQVLAAFPEFRARNPALPGVPQTIDAKVVDAGLQSYLGRSTVPLTFDAPGWRAAPFDPSKVNVCLRGAYRNQFGHTQVAPLLVKFRVKKGTVIFTSFHHSSNESKLVQQLLDYLVFASVTARSEARVRELMKRYDFASENVRPGIVNSDQPHEATFLHAGGGLQLALGFENQGAKLKLTLHSPSGQTIEHSDQGIFLIDVPKADPGEWRYTITPIELPHANFPILVARGAFKS